MASIIYLLLFVSLSVSARDCRSLSDNVVQISRLQKRSVGGKKEFRISTSDGDMYEMQLEKNDLIGQHAVTLNTPDGSVMYAPQDCHYHGSLTNRYGDVIINDCDGGLSGTIFTAEGDGKKTMTLKYDADNKKHYLFKNDEKEVDFPFKEVSDVERPIHSAHAQKRMKRGLDTTANMTKYISLALVADSTFFKKRYRSLLGSMNYLFAVANHVDHVFKSLNMRVALTEIELWTDSDKFNVTGDIYNNLKLFEGYNRDVLSYGRKWKHDNAHMLIGKHQDNGYRGLGAVGSLCYGVSSAVSYAWSDNPALTAGTVAHELGHNFGFHHITSDCKCSRPPCAMSATISYSPVNGLSDCCKKTMRSRCERGGCLCLLDKPRKIMGGPVCGNGFEERGEECDCGRPQYCNNPCCDPFTCKKKTGTQCAAGQCCENCQIKKKGSVCRPAAGECDISEHCDGVSAECPENIFLNDFSICNKDEGYCHMGVCSETLTEQCQSLWGKNAYHGMCQINENFMNMRGNKWGNCGITKTGFKQCRKSDVNCGKLQCYGNNLPPFILFGQSRRTMQYHVNGGTKCVTGTTNMGKDAGDITLAKPGTKCGNNKVCYENHCLDVAAIRSTFHSKIICDNQCGAHGKCTNKGLCYCKRGYKCPDCQQTDSANIDGRLCDQPVTQKTQGINKTKCPNGCSSNGICDGGKNQCFCFAGWKCPDCKNADPSNFNGQSCQVKKAIECPGPSKHKLKSVGCSVKLQNNFSLLADLRSKIVWEDFHKTSMSILCACADKVKSRGWSALGIQFWGECWGKAALPNVITESSRCKNMTYKACKDDGSEMCVGENHSAYLYQLV